MDNQAKVLSEQNNIEEISEIKIEKLDLVEDDIHNIEVIEIKMDLDSEYIYEEDPDYDSNEIIDIANIPVNEDIPEELILSNGCHEDESFKEEKLDDEEMAILEKDLKTTTQGYEHLTDQPKQVQQKSVKEQKSVTHSSLSTENSAPANYVVLTVQTTIEDKETATPEECQQKLEKKLRHKLRICHLCGKNYNTDSGFRHHMVMHRDPSFSCHMCGRVFWESQNLKKHLATLHSDDRPFQCHMCGMNYKRRDVLQEHIKRVHDGVKREWKEAFIRKHRSAPPKPAPPKKERHQCPYCNKCMSNKGYLQDHINGAHIKKALYNCEECDMTFTRKASYKYHYNRAHVLKKRVLEPRGTFLKDCEYCGLQFQVKKYYELHIAGKHFSKYPCEHCGEVFENKFQVTTHLETVHADQVVKCQFCQKTFLEDLHLKRHIYLCHNSERTAYECHECGRKANKKSTLAIHMRKHTGEKPYQCDMCVKRFAQSVDYRKHRAIHFKQKNEQRETELKKDCIVEETEEIGYSIECIDEKGNIEYETHFA